MSVTRRTFLSQAGVGAVAAAALAQPDLVAPSVHAASAGLSCSLPDQVETIAQATLAAVASLHTQSPDLPGFVSFDRYFAATYPEWLSEDDSTLLLGALYFKVLDAERAPIETLSPEAACRRLEAPLPTELFGPDFFKRLLAQAQQRVAANPDALAVYREAAARALAATDGGALAAYGTVDKIRRAAYVAGVIVGVILRLWL